MDRGSEPDVSILRAEGRVVIFGVPVTRGGLDPGAVLASCRLLKGP